MKISEPLNTLKGTAVWRPFLQLETPWSLELKNCRQFCQYNVAVVVAIWLSDEEHEKALASYCYLIYLSVSYMKMGALFHWQWYHAQNLCLLLRLFSKRCVLERDMCAIGIKQYTFLADKFFDFVASHTFQALPSWLIQQITLILWYLNLWCRDVQFTCTTRLLFTQLELW